MSLNTLVSASKLTVLLALTIAVTGCRETPKPIPAAPSAVNNVVASYFANADRQYETEDQQKEIVRALHDMLDRSPTELRGQRYADYQGKQDAWPLTTLIKRYFVPTQPMPDWSDDDFYRDMSKREAQEEIRKQLSQIMKEAAAR